MCLIVDVNIAHKVLISKDDPDFLPVREALFTTKKPPATLVYGGKLYIENTNRECRLAILELNRAGRTRSVSNVKIEAEIVKLEELCRCRSNDIHILALARVANVRLLCSQDEALSTDFTSKEIIDKPRGNVYRKASHRRLIVKHCKNK